MNWCKVLQKALRAEKMRLFLPRKQASGIFFAVYLLATCLLQVEYALLYPKCNHTVEHSSSPNASRVKRAQPFPSTSTSQSTSNSLADLRLGKRPWIYARQLRSRSFYYHLTYGSTMTQMCDLIRRTTITTRQGVLELLTTVDRRCLHISQRAERLSPWPGPL